MRRSWLRKNRPPQPSRARRTGGGRVVHFSTAAGAHGRAASRPDVKHKKAAFFWKASERRPWAIKRDDRPAALAGRSEWGPGFYRRDTGGAYINEYPIPPLRSGATGERIREISREQRKNFEGKKRGPLQGASGAGPLPLDPIPRWCSRTSMALGEFAELDKHNSEPLRPAVCVRGGANGASEISGPIACPARAVVGIAIQGGGIR